MADISQIKLPSGTVYNIKDATARTQIEALNSYSSYLGVTTTQLVDQSTTNPIVIGKDSITALKGNIVNYGSKEFIWNGTLWQEFGDLSIIGSLGKKDSASGSYTPAGSVTSTFTGSGVNYTPAGSVAAPIFTGTAATITSTISSGAVPSGGTGNYTPEGTISQPTFTGTAVSYTPEGSVSKPAITVTTTTGSVTGMSSVGTLPSCTLPSLSCSVANEVLTLGWAAGSFSAGSLPSKATAVTFVTGATAALNAAPTFTGTAKNVTAKGTVSAPTFTGTGTVLSASANYTPKGSNNAPKFTGTQASITAQGSVKSTFGGTNATITVS